MDIHNKRKKILTEKTLNQDPLEKEEFIRMYREKETRQVTTLYIELPYLFDIYLSSLLLLTFDNEQAYDYIISRLPAYDHRCLAGHAHVFPKLNIDEETLLETLKDSTYTDTLLRSAPPTDLWKAMKRLNREIVATNKSKESLGVDPVTRLTYLINTYPLVLNEEQARELKLRLAMGIESNNFNFGIISRHGKDLEYKLYQELDYIFAYNFHEWTADIESNGLKALNELRLERAYVFAPPRITNEDVISEMETYKHSDFLNLEKATLLMFNLLTNYQHYQAKILLVEDTEKTEQI